MNAILVALDFSQFSHEVESMAYDLANKLNTSIILVTIVNKFVEFTPADTGEVFVDLWEARKFLAHQNQMKVKEAHPGVETRLVSFVGDPKADIVAIASKEQAEFVIMGTHGRTGLSTFLVGSVAEYVIRHSSVPVIVVPHRKEKH